MIVEIKYKKEKLGRSTATVNGKKTTIKNAELLVAGKVPKKIIISGKNNDNDTLIYDI